MNSEKPLILTANVSSKRGGAYVPYGRYRVKQSENSSRVLLLAKIPDNYLVSWVVGSRDGPIGPSLVARSAIADSMIHYTYIEHTRMQSTVMQTNLLQANR